LPAGDSVTEYGRHDIVPEVGVDPSGYLIFTLADSDITYVNGWYTLFLSMVSTVAEAS